MLVHLQYKTLNKKNDDRNYYWHYYYVHSIEIVIKGNERYLEFATYILFSDLPNTPAFPEYNQGKMDDAWMQDLERVAAENPGTKTAGLITEFLEKVKANGNKLAPSTQKALSGKLNKLLVPKSTAASRPSAAEEKLLGKHMFSLQWIEGPMGEATVSRTENGAVCVLMQSRNTTGTT